MTSFWKQIVLEKHLLSVICAHPAMRELAKKIEKDPIKFDITTKYPDFRIASTQTVKLAAMVRGISLEKDYDPRFKLSTEMLNVIGDAMIFGCDNQNLLPRAKTSKPLTFICNKPITTTKSIVSAQNKLFWPNFIEINAAGIIGNYPIAYRLAQASRFMPALKYANGKRSAIEICLREYAGACLDSETQEGAAMDKDKFFIFMNALQKLLDAGCNPNYLMSSDPILDHPMLFDDPNFIDVCKFATLRHKEQSSLLRQLGNIFALLIKHGAAVPDQMQAPFKFLDKKGMELLHKNIVFAYNAQNPSSTIANLEQLQTLRTHRNRLK